ncbi:MAG TPA: type II toxin-antitoxin system VapC family toxin [Bryobacteraceae bacterium]|nr:type II toxin-antitoxin system VapC family toxin [Bryobacteraceae bacterium]
MILLDTHTLVWLRVEPAKLSPAASEAIRAARQRDGIAISAITLWELAWLATHGRLQVTGTVQAFVEKIASTVAIRPITAQIAVVANQLPSTYPSDPSDRLIGATAVSEGIPLVTKDRTIRNCKQIKTIW